MTSTITIADVREEWRDLLVDIEYAKGQHLVQKLASGRVLRSAQLEGVIASLFHLKAVSGLDRALIVWMADNQKKLPKGYRDLEGRIRFLAENSFFSNGPELHRIRKSRNALAHEPAASSDWKVLAADLKQMHASLEELGIVGPMPTFEVTATQHAATDGKIPGATLSQLYELTVDGSDGHGGTMSWEYHDMGD